MQPTPANVVVLQSGRDAGVLIGAGSERRSASQAPDWLCFAGVNLRRLFTREDFKLAPSQERTCAKLEIGFFDDLGARVGIPESKSCADRPPRSPSLTVTPCLESQNSGSIHQLQPVWRKGVAPRQCDFD